jgi:SAM-dependent methyltransferase
MTDVPRIFDRAVYLARQARASGEAVALLDRRIADELSDRLGVINRHFDSTLMIAPREEPFRSTLHASGKLAAIEWRRPMAEDDLSLPPESHDAVLSLLDLHAVNDVPGYLAQVATSLRPDGLALFCFFAGETLGELRQSWLRAEADRSGGASPRVAPMIDLREAGSLLQRAGLALPVTDLERLTLRYGDPFALMREVKALGYANPLTGRSNLPVPRSFLMQAAAAYAQAFSDADGRIRATVEIAWAMAWKPHASQQQPLRPGSAKMRLADALKVKGQT